MNKPHITDSSSHKGQFKRFPLKPFKPVRTPGSINWHIYLAFMATRPYAGMPPQSTINHVSLEVPTNNLLCLYPPFHRPQNGGSGLGHRFGFSIPHGIFQYFFIIRPPNVAPNPRKSNSEPSRGVLVAVLCVCC